MNSKVPIINKHLLDLNKLIKILTYVVFKRYLFEIYDRTYLILKLINLHTNFILNKLLIY